MDFLKNFKRTKSVSDGNGSDRASAPTTEPKKDVEGSSEALSAEELPTTGRINPESPRGGGATREKEVGIADAPPMPQRRVLRKARSEALIKMKIKEVSAVGNVSDCEKRGEEASARTPPVPAEEKTYSVSPSFLEKVEAICAAAEAGKAGEPIVRQPTLRIKKLSQPPATESTKETETDDGKGRTSKRRRAAASSSPELTKHGRTFRGRTTVMSSTETDDAGSTGATAKGKEVTPKERRSERKRRKVKPPTPKEESSTSEDNSDMDDDVETLADGLGESHASVSMLSTVELGALIDKALREMNEERLRCSNINGQTHKFLKERIAYAKGAAKLLVKRADTRGDPSFLLAKNKELALENERLKKEVTALRSRSKEAEKRPANRKPTSSNPSGQATHRAASGGKDDSSRRTRSYANAVKNVSAAATEIAITKDAKAESAMQV